MIHALWWVGLIVTWTVLVISLATIALVLGILVWAIISDARMTGRRRP